MKLAVILSLVVLVLVQVDYTKGSPQWSWTSFRDRISNIFSPTTTARPSSNRYSTIYPTLPTPPPRTYRTTTRSSITMPTYSITTRAPNQVNAARTCACGEETASVCASNGVTYKNSCKFECAKARVTRLRVVGTGACSNNMNRNEYWNSGQQRRT